MKIFKLILLISFLWPSMLFADAGDPLVDSKIGNYQIVFNATAYSGTDTEKIQAAIDDAEAANGGASGTSAYIPTGGGSGSGADPLGGWEITTTLTITESITIYGDTREGTYLYTTGADFDIFSIDCQDGVVIRDLKIYDKTGATDNAGIYAAFATATSNERIILRDLLLVNMYNGIEINDGYRFTIDNVHVANALNYGMWLANEGDFDGGDSTVTNCVITTVDGANAAIYQKSGGGLRIINNKLLGGSTGANGCVYGIHFDFNPTGNQATGSAILQISSNSIENFKTRHILLDLASDPGLHFGGITIVGNEFASWVTSTGSGIRIDQQELTGTHDGGNNEATVMTDSGASFTVDDLIGSTIYNTTDGSSGVITDNDGTTVTVAALAGGTDNDWDTNDAYSIPNVLGDIVIAANTFNNSGVEITDGDNINITGNVFVNGTNMTYAINNVGGTNVQASGNLFSGYSGVNTYFHGTFSTRSDAGDLYLYDESGVMDLQLRSAAANDVLVSFYELNTQKAAVYWDTSETELALYTVAGDIEARPAGGEFNVIGNIVATGTLAVNGDEITCNADLTITPAGDNLKVESAVLEVENDDSTTTYFIIDANNADDTKDPLLEFHEQGTKIWRIGLDRSNAEKDLRFANATNATIMLLNDEGDLWVVGDVSGASITDRPCIYKGVNALQELANIKEVPGSVDADGWAETDYSSLPKGLATPTHRVWVRHIESKQEMSQKDAMKLKDYKDHPDRYEEFEKEGYGTNIGHLLYIAVAAIVELKERIEILEAKLN